MEVSGQLHVPASLSQRQEPPAHSGQKAGWFLDRAWAYWGSDSLLPLPGIETPIFQPIA
jgi:hypothetical protein